MAISLRLLDDATVTLQVTCQQLQLSYLLFYSVKSPELLLLRLGVSDHIWEENGGYIASDFFFSLRTRRMILPVGVAFGCVNIWDAGVLPWVYDIG